MEKIYVIGVGMAPWNVPEQVKPLIYESDLLVGGRRLLGYFKGYSGSTAAIEGSLDRIIEQIDLESSRGKKVVVLADGDPLFFGIGKKLLEVLDPKRIEIIPNITTLQAAASRAKIPWNQVEIVSLHGRNDVWPLLRALAFRDIVGVYTGNARGPGFIASLMKSRGIDTFRMTIFEDLFQETEKATELSFEQASEMKFSGLNFVLLKRIKPPEIPLSIGIEDKSYVHERGMITKKEIRAVGLAELHIRRSDTVWDLGAGCGSVAIEASYLARDGKVFAVEKNRTRVEYIKENIRRTGAYLVEVVEGKMPHCLETLSDPDRIFLGGGMLGGAELIRIVCDRLKKGGRIVAHTVLLESLWNIKKHLEWLGWPFKIIEVNVARSSEVSGNIRLEALNPVFIIRAEKTN